jgi:hypothetical protein
MLCDPVIIAGARCDGLERALDLAIATREADLADRIQSELFGESRSVLTYSPKSYAGAARKLREAAAMIDEQPRLRIIAATVKRIATGLRADRRRLDDIIELRKMLAADAWRGGMDVLGAHAAIRDVVRWLSRPRLAAAAG